MTRVKRGVRTRARHKKILKMAKGFRSVNSKLFRVAKQVVMKAGLNSYRDRRLKKRTMRSLWTARMSAALRMLGTNYSQFTGKCFQKDVRINRKMFAELAAREPEVFTKAVEAIRA